jgi:hypothetical protein
VGEKERLMVCLHGHRVNVYDNRQSSMTTKDRMKLLTEWKEQFEKCDKAWTELEVVFRGLDTDSDIGMAVWDTFEKYTASISKIIGDTGDFLDWYRWENDMGANMMQAKAASWKKARKICDLKDLCLVIEADIPC